MPWGILTTKAGCFLLESATIFFIFSRPRYIYIYYFNFLNIDMAADMTSKRRADQAQLMYTSENTTVWDRRCSANHNPSLVAWTPTIGAGCLKKDQIGIGVWVILPKSAIYSDRV